MKYVLAALLLFSGAHATTMNQYQTSITRLTVALDSVGRAAPDLDATYEACADVEQAAEAVLALSRPAQFPRAAWTHAVRGTTYARQGAIACQNGIDELDVSEIRKATGYMKLTSTEIDLATSLLKRAR